MRVEPYLMMSGRCDEALAFYGRAVGATTTMVMRFDESPDKNHPMPLPPDWGQKIMHSSMTFGSTTVMMSDGMSTEQKDFHGISLSITADDEAQAKKSSTRCRTGARFSCHWARRSGRRALACAVTSSA